MSDPNPNPDLKADPKPNVASDIRRGGWSERSLPERLRPFGRLARLDRPIGTWLLLLPCWWGLALAVASGVEAEPWRVALYAVLFAIGALAMRGAGCTWNDILDRDYDAKVARTAERPIPAGEVSVKAAAIFLVLQLLVGLAVLLSLNWQTILIGASSLVLVALYPLMKRITYWPQAWLGLTFNWGALVGWSALAEGLTAPALLLYAGGVFWTLGYDTIYAHQDKEDDAIVGVKSTALKFGAKSRPWVAAFYGLALFCWMAALWAAQAELMAYLALVLVAMLLARQAGRVDFDDPADCLTHFKANRDVGLLLTAAIALGHPALNGGWT